MATATLVPPATTDRCLAAPIHIAVGTKYVVTALTVSVNGVIVPSTYVCTKISGTSATSDVTADLTGQRADSASIVVSVQTHVTGIPGGPWTSITPIVANIIPPRPVRVPSFGPNGTHWPEDTPWLYDEIPNVVDVACTWAAIKAAVVAVTPEQAAAGAHIRIAPGELVGLGGGSSGTPVLDKIGNAAWTKRVLVTPRDGWGTVTLQGSVKFRQVKRVCFALLHAPDPGDVLTMQMCNGSALAWSDLDGWLILGLAGGPGTITEHTDLYEVVVDHPQLKSADPTGLGAGYTQTNGGPADGNGMLRDCLLEGCYTAPRWRVQGASDHVDTLQTYSGGGMLYGFTLRDSVLWGSNNCALMCAGVSEAASIYLPPDAGEHVVLDHTLLVGPTTAQASRYPAMTGGTAVAGNQATNAGGGVQGMSAYDSIIAGTTYPTTWNHVRNTRIPAERPTAVVTDGSWTIDPSLLTADASYFDNISTRPSQEYLTSIWT